MASIAPGEVVRVSARFKSSVAGDIVNVYRWRNDGASAVTDTDFKAAAKAKLSTAWAFITNDVANTCTPFDIRFDKVQWVGASEVVTEALGTDSWVLSTPPSGSGEMLTPMDAVIINFRTTLPGSFGRKYIGAVLESAQSAGTLIAATVTRMGQFSAELLTALNAGGMTFSFGALSAKVGFTGQWVPYTAAVINALMGTQRRRRKNSGS